MTGEKNVLKCYTFKTFLTHIGVHHIYQNSTKLLVKIFP